MPLQALRDAKDRGDYDGFTYELVTNSPVSTSNLATLSPDKLIATGFGPESDLFVIDTSTGLIDRLCPNLAEVQNDSNLVRIKVGLQHCDVEATVPLLSGSTASFQGSL